MSKNGRRALFYAFSLLFLILGTGMVLFAQGWRIDFPSFRVSKVGGIYVRPYPENAALFLNGKPVKSQVGFLNYSTLISNLFPRTYRLTLTAPGYDDWQENVNVQPSFVANHKYAILVPANGTPVAKNAVAHFVAAGGQNIIQTSGGEIVADGKAIGQGKIISASPDMRSLLFQAPDGTYELADLSAETAANFSMLLSAGGFAAIPSNQIFPDPSGDQKFFAVDAQKVGWFDLSQATGTVIAIAPKGTVITPLIATSPDTATAAWIRSRRPGNATSSLLIFYDLSSGDITSTTVTLDSPVKKLSWVTGNLLGILTESGDFSLYDANQHVLNKIADDVRDVSITPDGSRIATLESQSMEIFTLNDPEGYYRFNIPNVADAQAAIWYRDNDHLFIAYPDHVSFLDLEDAGLTNFVTVSSGTSPEYDPQSNALFLTDPRNHLLQFDFPK